MPDTLPSGLPSGAEMGQRAADAFKRAQQARDQIIEQRFMRAAHERPPTPKEVLEAVAKEQKRFEAEDAYVKRLVQLAETAGIAEQVQIKQVLRDHQNAVAQAHGEVDWTHLVERYLSGAEIRNNADYDKIVKDIREAWGEAYRKYYDRMASITYSLTNPGLQAILSGGDTAQEAGRDYVAETQEILKEAQDLAFTEHGLNDEEFLGLDLGDQTAIITAQVNQIITPDAVKLWEEFAAQIAADQRTFEEGEIVLVTQRMRRDLDRQKERLAHAGIDPAWVMSHWEAVRRDVKVKLIEESGIIGRGRAPFLTNVSTNAFIDALLWAFPDQKLARSQRPVWIRDIEKDWSPAEIGTFRSFLTGNIGNEPLGDSTPRSALMNAEFAARALENRDFGIGGAGAWDFTLHAGGQLDPVLGAFVELAWAWIFPGFTLAIYGLSLYQTELAAQWGNRSFGEMFVAEHSGEAHSASLLDLFLVGEFARGSLLKRLGLPGGISAGEKEVARIFEAPKAIQEARIKYVVQRYWKWRGKLGKNASAARKRLEKDLASLVREARDLASEDLQRVMEGARHQQYLIEVNRIPQLREMQRRAVRDYKDRQIIEAGQRVSAAASRTSGIPFTPEEQVLIVAAMGKLSAEAAFWLDHAAGQAPGRFEQVLGILNKQIRPKLLKFELEIRLKVPMVPVGSRAAKIIEQYAKLDVAGVWKMTPEEIKFTISVIGKFDPNAAAMLEGAYDGFESNIRLVNAVTGKFQQEFLRVLRNIDHLNKLSRR